MKHLLVWLITVYQRTLSPDHGMLSFKYPYGYCKYHPSCSEYAKQSIAAKGVFRGVAMSCWRVIRCNPFTKGGYDPV